MLHIADIKSMNVIYIGQNGPSLDIPFRANGCARRSGRRGSLRQLHRLPRVPRGAPNDCVAVDLEVTGPTSLMPLAGVDHDGAANPAVPEPSEMPLKGRLVDMPTDHEVGLVANDVSVLGSDGIGALVSGLHSALAIGNGCDDLGAIGHHRPGANRYANWLGSR